MRKFFVAAVIVIVYGRLVEFTVRRWRGRLVSLATHWWAKNEPDVLRLYCAHGRGLNETCEACWDA